MSKTSHVPVLHAIGWTVPISGAVTDTQNAPALGASAVAFVIAQAAKSSVDIVRRIATV